MENWIAPLLIGITVLFIYDRIKKSSTSKAKFSAKKYSDGSYKLRNKTLRPIKNIKVYLPFKMKTPTVNLLPFQAAKFNAIPKKDFPDNVMPSYEHVTFTYQIRNETEKVQQAIRK